MKRKRRTGLIIFSILVIIVVVRIGGIIHQRFDKTSTKTVRLGLVGTDSEPVWDNVRKRLKKQGINIEYVVFNDYVQPDVALKEGKIDMHSCLMIFSRKSRDFSHGMDRLTQRPFGHFFFWSALYF